jgi:hypothetical protein
MTDNGVSLPDSGRHPIEEVPIARVLREAIQAKLDAGTTMYRIAYDAQVPWQTVQLFMQRKRFLSIPSCGRLCESLGLRLVKDI